jgi:hypothetical protein
MDEIINNKNVNKSSKGMVLNLNIFGHNVEVNFDENHKQMAMNSVPKQEVPKVSTVLLKAPGDTGARVTKYPEYLTEIRAPKTSDIFSKRIDKRSDELNSIFEDSYSNKGKGRKGSKYLELALFVDLKAYENLKANGLIETESDFHEMLLSYINQIQAIYSHKLFAPNFFINLVKIEIQKEDIFSHTNGNRDEMLTKFCEYQSVLNPVSDSDPMHWDMSLLLTGYDLYVVKDDGTRDYKSLGLGTVSGICTVDRNCVISEFEPIMTTGEIWPSSGLMSTWAAAHEMAHKYCLLVFIL